LLELVAIAKLEVAKHPFEKHIMHDKAISKETLSELLSSSYVHILWFKLQLHLQILDSSARLRVDGLCESNP